MTDYSDIGLNSNLQSVNSIPANSVSFVNSVDFESDYDRGIVTNAKLQNLSITSAKIGTAVITNANIATAAIGTANIGTLSFNEIHGGTGIFGGTNSGSGVVSVLNNAGSEVVRLDGTGITVRNGSINIQNSSGSSVIDSGGLVSSAAFSGTSSVIGAAEDTTSSEDQWITTPGGTLTLARSRSTWYLVGMSVNCANKRSYSADLVLFRFQLNGTTIGPLVAQSGESGTYTSGLVAVQTASSSFVYNAPSGTNDLILQWSRWGGGTALINATAPYVNQLYAIQLGV